MGQKKIKNKKILVK